MMRATQPFRWFFQRLEVALESGRPVGALQQRFSFLYKRFDVLDSNGQVSMRVSSPFWRPWTFSFQRDGREVARIEKKRAGILREAFTDSDPISRRVHRAARSRRSAAPARRSHLHRPPLLREKAD